MKRIGIERLNGEEMETLSFEQASRINGAGVTFTVWPYPTYSSTVIYRPTPFAFGPYGFSYAPSVVYPTYSSGWYFGW